MLISAWKMVRCSAQTQLTPATRPVDRQGTQVHPGGVEERLHQQTLFIDAVSHPQQKEAEPAFLPAYDQLTAQDRPAAVQQRQGEEGERVVEISIVTLKRFSMQNAGLSGLGSHD